MRTALAFQEKSTIYRFNKKEATGSVFNESVYSKEKKMQGI